MGLSMTKTEVIQAIRDELPDAYDGKTLRYAPDNLKWRKVNWAPVQYHAKGLKLGNHFIGVATQVNSRIISYGR